MSQDGHEGVCELFRCVSPITFFQSILTAFLCVQLITNQIKMSCDKTDDLELDVFFFHPRLEVKDEFVFM